jgi:hypothetical protein
MNFAYASILQMKKMLVGLDKWLEKAIDYAKGKSFEPVVLLNCRLIADMYPLVRQVQSCCDTAKFAAARLSGQEAPKHPDTEQTIDEIRARIRACVDYLETFKESSFAEADKRLVSLSFIPDKVLLGSDYLVEMVLPNFYFHVTTAYDILRHNGVDVGKMDFIGSLTMRDK